MNHFVPHQYSDKRQNEQNEQNDSFFPHQYSEKRQNEQNESFFHPPIL